MYIAELEHTWRGEYINEEKFTYIGSKILNNVFLVLVASLSWLQLVCFYSLKIFPRKYVNYTCGESWQRHKHASYYVEFVYRSKKNIYVYFFNNE